MKNKGFSLIEVTVAIALIGIMAGIGVPKLRRQMALGRDTKAIATLGTLRTASELYFIENSKPLSETPTSEESENITTALKKLGIYSFFISIHIIIESIIIINILSICFPLYYTLFLH